MTAYRIIDLGPEGGGEVVAVSTLEDIVRGQRSYTRRFLKPELARSSPARGKKRSDRGSGVALIPRKFFYAWQSERPGQTCRQFIRDALRLCCLGVRGRRNRRAN